MVSGVVCCVGGNFLGSWGGGERGEVLRSAACVGEFLAEII